MKLLDYNDLINPIMAEECRPDIIRTKDFRYPSYEGPANHHVKKGSMGLRGFHGRGKSFSFEIYPNNRDLSLCINVSSYTNQGERASTKLYYSKCNAIDIIVPFCFDYYEVFYGPDHRLPHIDDIRGMILLEYFHDIRTEKVVPFTYRSQADNTEWYDDMILDFLFGVKELP